MNNTEQQTVAYQRALPRTWQRRAEDVITRIRDTYDALWDVMPAIAAFVVLILLINTFSK